MVYVKYLNLAMFTEEKITFDFRIRVHALTVLPVSAGITKKHYVFFTLRATNTAYDTINWVTLYYSVRLYF